MWLIRIEGLIFLGVGLGLKEEFFLITVKILFLGIRYRSSAGFLYIMYSSHTVQT